MVATAPPAILRCSRSRVCFTSQTVPSHRRKSPRLKDKIIPLEEDIRRLFQECKIGQGNAALLSEALAFARPEDLNKDIIRVRMGRIATAVPEANPSRATLQSVNSFLMDWRG